MSWVAVAIVNTAVSAYGAMQQSAAAQANAQAQADAANYNAKVQENNALAARQQANAREEAMRRNQRIELGKTRAAMSQSGLNAQTGSLLDMYDQSAVAMELDALNTRYEGEMQARGLTAQSQMSKHDASVAMMNKSQAKTAGYIGVASSLLNGVSSYGKAQKVGYF